MQNKKRNTRQRMYKLIRKYESSGISQAKFAEEHQISKSTLGYWRKKYLQENSMPEPSSKMIPVNILPPKNSEPVSQLQNIEIIYPNGIRVICPLQMEIPQVKELIF